MDCRGRACSRSCPLTASWRSRPICFGTFLAGIVFRFRSINGLVVLTTQVMPDGPCGINVPFSYYPDVARVVLACAAGDERAARDPRRLRRRGRGDDPRLRRRSRAVAVGWMTRAAHLQPARVARPARRLARLRRLKRLSRFGRWTFTGTSPPAEDLGSGLPFAQTCAFLPSAGARFQKVCRNGRPDPGCQPGYSVKLCGALLQERVSIETNDDQPDRDEDEAEEPHRRQE